MKDASYGATTTARTYSTELYVEIRNEHTKLNKLITSRLPLCLPPFAESPVLYAQGISVFGLVFQQIEKHLKRHLTNGDLNDKMTKVVEYLNIPGLQRTDRLHGDIKSLKSIPTVQALLCHPAHLNTLAAATTHINTSLAKIDDNPHLLLAYTWTMYLALFNGGRWIRAQLERPGTIYWGDVPRLSFWRFEGERDGDEVHEHFKRNFEKAVALFTHGEWLDVKAEAKSVFDLCEDLVVLLDAEAEWRVKEAEQWKHGHGSLSAIMRRSWVYASALLVLIFSVFWLWKG